MSKYDTLAQILCRGIVPLLVADKLPPRECLNQMQQAGIEAVAISCSHPEALALITEAKSRFSRLAVGATALLEDGRMRDAVSAGGHPVPSVAQAVDAGADFLVSLLPFREGTYERYRDSHVIIPGVTTPGEAQQALDWGANLLQFSNPHLLGGPDFFRSLDPATYGAFPYFVTGGIKANIAAGYIEAGVLAVGAGLDLILGPEYIALQAVYDEYVMRERLTDYLTQVDRARQRHQPTVPFASKDLAAIQRASGRCLNL